ncbi:histidine kinase [Streptomyces sp. I4(2020)]|uniref:sensor histidine kinase n=1 Tax=Streptomyces sp. I4(2020) TaxID=2760981 RepID=UPI0027DE3578|nr:histidine kinase [Streptomyces sp. I4(2020)]
MTGHLTIGRGGGPTAACSVGRLDRARTAALAGRCLLWAGLVVPGLCAVRLGLSEPRPVWQQAAGAGVLAAATALARRRPLAAFALTAALCLADAPALFGLSYGPALAVFALLLGLRAERTGPAALGFAAVAAAGTVRIALGGGDPVPPWLVMTGTLVFGCVLPWLGGRYWRQSRELTAAGRLRAARLEEEQRLAEKRARLRERARIAQDMHDSLGPELSLLALRAGGLQVAPDLPERHRVAVAGLRAAAADATDRLHRIIGVLREDDDEPLPLVPAGETVGQLVARAAGSGLPVRCSAGGRPPEPGGVAERLLHHVTREALTNAARHAPGAPVVVELTGGPGATVTVTNGPATEPGSAHSGGGTGPLGLRAAVTAVGGTFEAGPHGADTGCGPTSPSGRAGRRRRPVRPPRPSPAPAAGWRPRWGPPRARAWPWSRRRPAGTRTPRRTRSSNPPPTPPSAPALRSPPSPCPTGRSRTRRPTAPPPRPRAPTAATTARAANCSSPSTTTGSASTTRADWSPRTSSRARAADGAPPTRSSRDDPGPAGRRRGDGAGRGARHPGQRR